MPTKRSAASDTARMARAVRYRKTWRLAGGS